MYKINIFGGRTFCTSFFLPHNIVVDVFIMWHRQPSRAFYLIIKNNLRNFFTIYVNTSMSRAREKPFTINHTLHKYRIRDVFVFDATLFVKKISHIYFFMYIYLRLSIFPHRCISAKCPPARPRFEPRTSYGRCNNQ
jgi:hypothetical protein